MPAAARQHGTRKERATTAWARQLRLGTGLVLLAFVTSHFLNHAAGLVSLATMEGGAQLFNAFWRSPPGTVLLYGSFALHMPLALWAVMARRTWRGIRRGEVAQILLGLTVPPLAISHIVATRGVHAAWDFNDRYAYVLHALYLGDGWEGLQQLALLLVVWLHGCLGVHFWLRLKSWYPRVQLALYTIALLVPLAAILGFFHAGREVGRLLALPDWRDAYWTSLNYAGPQVNTWAADMTDGARIGMAVVLATALAGRYLWLLGDRRRARITLTYPGERIASLRPGSATVLEASRMAGIPHASVCGGRGRCSTCRVRIAAGEETLPPPAADELRVLRRVGAPPGVRLACQIRPQASLRIHPLLPAGAGPRDARQRDRLSQGLVAEICVLFADLRAFTRFSEQKLPYDIVFVANQYFRLMGEAVERAGGRVDKFIGDGVMALFGINGQGPGSADAGSAAALRAAGEMALALDELNRTFARDLEEPFRLGIGIHCGPAIVGEMGHGAAISVTAIGDTVNTASRLETATKEFGAQLVVSRLVLERAGIAADSFVEAEIEVRGRSTPMAVRWLADARILAGPDRFQAREP